MGRNREQLIGAELDEVKERARQLQREYMRKWRARNKERVKETNERVWLKKALKERKAKGAAGHE